MTDLVEGIAEIFGEHGRSYDVEDQYAFAREWKLAVRRRERRLDHAARAEQVRYQRRYARCLTAILKARRAARGEPAMPPPLPPFPHPLRRECR